MACFQSLASELWSHKLHDQKYKLIKKKLSPGLNENKVTWYVDGTHDKSIEIFRIKYIIIWSRQWHPTPVLLPGKSHGRRSLVGCSPWGRWESDTTERLHFHFLPSRIGEGNGNPVQCSCLENPRDGGALWAAVYGVAESDTTEAT